MKIKKDIRPSFTYRLYSLLIYYLLYIASASFSFSIFGLDEGLAYLLNALLRFLVFLLACFSFYRNMIFDGDILPISWKRGFLFLPCFLICFGNLLSLIWSEDYQQSPAFSSLSYYIPYYLALALCEETILIYGFSHLFKEKCQRPLAILGSALIFGASHLIGIFSGNIAGSLIQAGYTFLLGLLLGIIINYGGGLVMAISLHFLFDLFQGEFYLCLSNGEWGLSFYLANLFISLLVTIYLLGLFWISLKANKVEIDEQEKADSQ